MHTAELDSAVGCTPQSQSDWFENVCFSCFCTCYVYVSTPFIRKTSEAKKIPWTICDLQHQFHINIFRHHREIAFVKLRTSYWLCGGCTPWSFWRIVHHLTPRCDAHRGAWLRGGMQVGCTLQSFLKIQISWRNGNLIRKKLFIRGPDGFQSWKKLEVENLLTHSL